MIKGDSVVILTKKQAKDINDIFESQKSKITYYKHELSLKDSLITSTDTLLLEKQEIINNFIFNHELGQRLDLLEHWLFNAAINGTWLYYSWTDSLIYSVDLSQYYVRKDDATGDMTFLRSDDLIDPENNKEEPKREWYKDIIKPKRPKVTVVPVKL